MSRCLRQNRLIIEHLFAVHMPPDHLFPLTSTCLRRGALYSITQRSDVHCAQEALISRGSTKSEAAAAELMYKSLAYKPNTSDSPYCELPREALKGKTSSTPGSSPRDTVPASSSDADAASAAASKDGSAASAAASKDGGAASARGVAPSGAKGGAATPASVTPRDALIDYTIFEQLWMADFTNAIGKAV